MYRILIDYGSEGLSYLGVTSNPDEFETLKEAVEEALKMNMAHSFEVVKVIKWEAKETI